MAANLEVVRIILVEPTKGALVIQRPETSKNSPGEWSLVGGKTDGEPGDVAARREIYEELGIQVQGLNFLCTRTRAYRSRDWGMTYFWQQLDPEAGQQIRENFNRSEIADVDFLQRSRDIESRRFAFGDHIILEWFMRKVLGRI